VKIAQPERDDILSYAGLMLIILRGVYYRHYRVGYAEELRLS